MSRVFLTVLDAVGAGDAPDAALIIIAFEALKLLDHLAVSLHRLFIMIYGDLFLQCPLALAEFDDIIKGPAELIIECPLAKICLLLDIADRIGTIKLYRAAI